MQKAEKENKRQYKRSNISLRQIDVKINDVILQKDTLQRTRRDIFMKMRKVSVEGQIRKTTTVRLPENNSKSIIITQGQFVKLYHFFLYHSKRARSASTVFSFDMAQERKEES